MNLPTKLPSLSKPRIFDRSQKEAYARRQTGEKSVPPQPAVKEMRSLKSVDKSRHVSVDRVNSIRTSKNIFSYAENKEDKRRPQILSPSPLRAVKKATILSQTHVLKKSKAKGQDHQSKNPHLASSVFKVV